MGTTRTQLRLVFCLLGAATIGCGTYAVSPAPMPKLPVPPAAARVCVVRPGTSGPVGTFPVRDNSILVGATVGGSCFCYFAGAGQHEIEARTDGYDHIDVDIKPGGDVVLLQTVQAAVGITRSHLDRMTGDDGKRALAACQYSVLTEVPEGTYKTKPETVIAPK
jgi:hypothetical protein